MVNFGKEISCFRLCFILLLKNLNWSDNESTTYHFVFQKALVVYFSHRIFPLSHRLLETAAHLTIWKFVTSVIYVLHITTARTLCRVNLRFIGVCDKRAECGKLMAWRQNKTYYSEKNVSQGQYKIRKSLRPRSDARGEKLSARVIN